MKIFCLAGLLVSAACAQVLLQHDYDALGDRVTSVAVHPGERLTQSLTGRDVTAHAFRLKLRRVGTPGPLTVRAGSTPGAADLGSAVIPAAEVQPYFEAYTNIAMKPVRLAAGKRYYLQISVENGPGFYEWFGTTSEGPETAINQDYGAATPSFRGGEALDANGRAIAGTTLAFQVLGPAGAPGNVEEPFRFISDLIAPPHYRRTRHWRLRGGAGEATLDGSWTLELLPSAGPVARNAAAEFRAYLAQAMGVTAGAETSRRIVAGTAADLPAYQGKLSTSESFAIDVQPDRITVAGFDDRGVMRGLFHLQDLLDLRQAPILKVGAIERKPRYNPRITCAPFFAGTELEPNSDPYTDGLLSKIAHAGYNALFVWGKLYELGRSSALPELGADAPARLARLKALTDRAAAHGIDVYLYLTLDPLPASFFDKHPDARGVPRNYGGFYGGAGYVLCTSTPVVHRFLEEGTASIFRTVPALRGVIMIPSGEGMFSCRAEGRNTCPRCANRARNVVLAEMVGLVQRGARSVSPKAEVATWTYTWPQGDPTRVDLIGRLPKDMIWLSTFDKEGIIRKDGIEDPAYDYTISYLGPSENFRRQVPLVEKAGLPLWAKTESMISQEFVQAPYIPIPQRWIVRYRRLAAFPRISGLFLSWNHYGFMPSRVSELVKWYTWDPMPQADEILQQIAARDFGDAGPGFVQAWDKFSEAIAEYPLSDNTSRNGPFQKGPAHPFFADPEYQPKHSDRRQFFNTLQWTMPWDVPVARKYFDAMERGWSEGVQMLHKAADAVSPENRAEAAHEVGIAEMQLSCVRMVLNLMDYYQERQHLATAPDPKVFKKRMAALLRKERENTLRALPYVEADSRLGYANGGNGITNGGVRAGIFTAASIRKKLAQLEQTLRALE